MTKNTSIKTKERDDASFGWLIILIIVLVLWGVWIWVYFYNIVEKKTEYTVPIIKEKYNNSTSMISNTGENLITWNTTIETWDTESEWIENSSDKGNNITEKSTLDDSFVLPDGTNIELEEVSLEKIKKDFDNLAKKLKQDPDDATTKYELSKLETDQKIINFFKKKYPEEEIKGFYTWEEMLYYTIRTKNNYYNIMIENDFWTDWKQTTKLLINPIKWVDMSTFELYDRYAKDKNHVYRDGEIISWADTKTFVSYDRNYAKDKNHIYCLWDIMEADYDTFQVLNEDYAKDKNHVYTYGNILEWADVETFQILNKYYAKDKNHVYTYGDILEWTNPETFDPENPNF